MRGKVFLELVQVTFDRITPAYAGKSSHLHAGTDTQQDHPRLCGEKFSYGRGSADPVGSPPPMRGKARSSVKSSVQLGITPAYAGKSTSSRFHTAAESGSPPPMRGKATTAMIRV